MSRDAGRAEMQANPTQVFVRNLSYSTTTEELLALFEAEGPIKHGEVVVDAKTGASRGFGFVKFSLPEDATNAVAKLQGANLGGRKIMVELAVKKAREKKSGPPLLDATATATTAERSGSNLAKESIEEEEVEVGEGEDEEEEEGEDEDEAAQPDKARTSSTSVRPGLQILLFGSPVDLTKRILLPAIKKINRKTLLELIKEDHPMCESLQILSPAGKIFLLTAPSKPAAAKLLAKLDKVSPKMLGLKNENDVGDGSSSAAWKEKMVARSVAQLTAPEFRKRHCRLIVRNLSFEATEANVADKLGQFGPLVEVALPKVAVDKPVKGKNKKNQGEVQKLKSRGFAFVTFLCSADAGSAVQSTGPEAVAAGKVLKVCNRTVAVDYCVRKDHFVETAGSGSGSGDAATDAPAETGDAEAGAQDDEDEDEDEEDEDDEDDEDEDKEDDNEDEDEDDEDEDEDEDEEDDEDEKTKENTDDVNEGCTVFFRGLSLDAGPTDLRQAAKVFGKVVMAVIVKAPDGTSRGSAFVKFSSKAEAEACVSAASSGPGLLVRDRACKVDIAVDREKAQHLSEAQKTAKDKRHLFLANEGLSLSPEELKDMPDEEVEKRRRAQAEKKKKLLNPLFAVSAVRLSIRNLNKSVDDAELKKLCLAAAKKGLEKKRATTKDMDALLTAQGVSSVERSQDKLRSLLAPLGKGSLRSAKVMLDMERKRGGLAQSRGYGFVEFKEHAHALACLRELNNNAAYCSSAAGATSKTGLRPRLIVEFTLENMQKVMILKRREERAVKRKTDSLDSDPSSDAREDQEQPAKKPKTSSSSSSSAAAVVAVAASAAATTAAAPGESGKKRQREDDVVDDSEQQQQKQLRDKKLAKEKRKAIEKKRKEKVLARKLKKEGKGGEIVATTSSLPNDASPSNKRKGLFGRIRAEKKEKRAAKV